MENISKEKLRLMMSSRMRTVRWSVRDRDYKKAIKASFSLGCLIQHAKDFDEEVELLDEAEDFLEKLDIKENWK